MQTTLKNGAVITILLLTVAFGASAADGIIQFTGNIIDQTCSVDSTSQNQTVVPGKVARSTLNGTVGMKSSPTRFTLVVKSCPETITGVRLKFDGISNDKYPNLLMLDSGTGVATGVAVEIADKTGAPIPLHTASPEYTLTTGTNNLDFVARYVSTAVSISVGIANATT